MEIKEIIRSLVDTEQDVAIKIATVKSIEDDRTCTVLTIDEDLELSGVRLQGAIGSTEGVYLTPAVNSIVMVVVIATPFICLTTELDKIELRGSSLGGLTKTIELRDQLEATHELLESLLSVINGVQILEPGNGAPSALQAALSSAMAGKSLGVFNDIENENILQG